MNNKSKRTSVKAGLPPGSLVHIGNRSTETPLFRLIRYNAAGAQEIELNQYEQLQEIRKQDDGILWLDVIGLNHLETIEGLGKLFNIHPLVLEDIVNTEQRPKFEQYDDFFFLTLKTLVADGPLCNLDTGQLSLLCGKNFVISFQEKDNQLFTTVTKRLMNGASRARTRTPDFLVYLLSDAIVDSYFPVIEKFTDTVDEIDARILKENRGNTLQHLQTIRRNFSALLVFLYPLREALSRIDKRENELLADETRLYFRDVYDHTLHLTETVENLREILSGSMEIYLASTNNRMNAVMKVLTVIATIFIPLSFLASVYGMNFKHFPELEWKYGYLYFWIFVLLIVGLMFYFFRKKKWL